MREIYMAVLGWLLGHPKPTSEEACGETREHPRLAEDPKARTEGNGTRPPQHAPRTDPAAAARVHVDASAPRPAPAAPDRREVSRQPYRWTKHTAANPTGRSDVPPAELTGYRRMSEARVLDELADLTDKLNDPYAAAQAMFGDGRG